MGLFDFLSSSPKKVTDTAMDLITAGKNGIDMIFYTDEERAIAGDKFYTRWVEMVEKMVDTESIRSITRRYIAVSIIVTWLSLILISVGLTAFDLTDRATAVFRIIESMGMPVLAIIGFYFGPEMIGRMLPKKK